MKKKYLSFLAILLLFASSCKSTGEKTLVVSLFPNYTTYLTAPENENPKPQKVKEIKTKDTKKTTASKSKDIKENNLFYGEYQIKETERGNVLILDTKVMFYFQSLKLKKDSQKAFKDVKEFMIEHPNVKIIVEGHTDKTGKPSYNYTLANKRSYQGVKSLTDIGVAKSRLIARSLGSKLPEYATNTENRRLEFVIIENADDLKKYESFMKRKKI